MKLRPPAIPLITVDPYFSVWAPHEVLNFRETQHWTRKHNPIRGYVDIDGESFMFMGYERKSRKIPQIEMDTEALTTRYTFENEKIRLKVQFMTPLIPDNLYLLTRPVSYISVSYEKKLDTVKSVSVKIVVGEGLCLDRVGEKPTVTEERRFNGITAIKMGAEEQLPLNRCGDDLRIDWGYVYLATPGEAECATISERAKYISLKAALDCGVERLFMLAYDDLGASINYFGKTLCSYWNKDGKTVEEAITEAARDFSDTRALAEEFSDKLCADAYMAGGEKYSDLLCLAYRQVIAAHKLVVDEDGEILFISKECFSNGCAATVDVSYPSIPLFLIYNTELIKGMLRPIYRFAESGSWKYDFAPHDAGRYPLVTGQVYGLDKETGELLFDRQMPVEECGNMIIMEANIALADGNADFARPHIDTLKKWCEYLIKYGDDPENQLCTDDFAGHLAHNCNLSLKAIMGIMGMSILVGMLGDERLSAKYRRIAKKKAKSWCERAANPDGSYRLAFDKEASYSMKYNMVWDKIWGTGLFPRSVYKSELASNFARFNKYGMPLDNRCDQTKSDWLTWCATMTSSKREFEKYIAPMWQFYNDTPDRIAMTDWYDTASGTQIGFLNRTVQGGLYIKLLDYIGKQKKLK